MPPPLPFPLHPRPLIPVPAWRRRARLLLPAPCPRKWRRCTRSSSGPLRPTQSFGEVGKHLGEEWRAMTDAKKVIAPRTQTALMT